MELERNENLSATAYNILRSCERLGDLAGIRAAHLREISRAIVMELGEEAGAASLLSEHAGEIYRRFRTEAEAGIALVPELLPEERFFSGELSLFDTLCICRGISGEVSPSERELREAVSGAECAGAVQSDVRIAFAPGREANLAFERFAGFFSSATPDGEENFQTACELAAGGECDYCMIPVENSADGRLGGFYRLIEKNGLYIVSVCRIWSRDGENYTKFALCSREMTSVGIDGEKIFHFRATLAGMGEIEAIASAARFFGAEVKRADTIPPALSGRDNSLDVVLGIGECDIFGLLCFLKFEFPQFTPTGFYIELGGNE